MAEDQNDDEPAEAPKRNRGQFPKGISGNPRGRPKRSKNLKTYLVEQLSKKLTLTENGKSRSVTRAEAIAIQLVASAAKGDPRGLAAVLSLTRENEAAVEAAGTVLSREEDHEVFEGLLKRLRAASDDPDTESSK